MEQRQTKKRMGNDVMDDLEGIGVRSWREVNEVNR